MSVGAHGAENKVLVMLDLLPLRTSQVYDKLADALHVSGHSLLADFLREEDLSKQPLNVKELFKRLPFLSNNMRDTEKKQIEAYMSEKIQSAILSHTWQWDTKEKDKALCAKQEQLEEAHQHEQEMKNKHQQLLETQKQLKATREETLAMKAELRAMNDNSSRLQQQMRGHMDTQMRFSMANDSIAQRTSQRLQTAEAILRAVQDKLHTVVRMSPRNQEQDQMRLAENPFVFLPEDVDVFLGQFRKLLVVQLKYEELVEEKNYILTHLGLPPVKIDEDDDQQVSLLKAYKEFTVTNDARIESLEKEVAHFGGLLDDVSRTKAEEEKKLAHAGTVWQNAIMSVMRKQLQDLKSAMRKKDSTLEIKDADITRLRCRVSELETSLRTRAQDADLAARSVTIHDLHNGHAASLDSFEPPTSASPRPTSHNNNNNNNGLPPLKSAGGASHKTSSSPRPGVVRLPKSRVSSVPRGIVVHTDTPLNMYPAGLTTMQLRVDHQAPQPRVIAPSTADPRGGKPPMGSTLGDLRAMHSRYPGASRGPQSLSGGGGGDGSSATSMAASKGINSSPAARRKITAKVK
ncbi:hypothetical protein ACOMHN_046642 [Nucella lapillus]